MARKYRSYTDQQLIEAVRNNKSIAGLLRELGLIPAGGNYFQIKQRIAKLNLDISHFTGQGWNNGQSLKALKDYKRSAGLKSKLIKERGHKCEECSLTEWLKRAIKLELHHKDGNRVNNIEDNLLLLCPNCHAFTDNFRRPKPLRDEIGST